MFSFIAFAVPSPSSLYSVGQVGVLEEKEKTLQVMECLMPDYMRGLNSLPAQDEVASTN